jgi:hypothetical protein
MDVLKAEELELKRDSTLYSSNMAVAMLRAQYAGMMDTQI